MSLPVLTPITPDPIARTAHHGVWPSFGAECRQTLTLAFPLIAGQLSQMLMGVVDTVMVGRIGVVPLGAATFANTLLSVPLILGIGLLTSVSVRTSNARGAGNPGEAQSVMRHGLWLALGYGLLVVAAFALLLPWLGLFHQPPEVTAQTPRFLMICAISLVPALLTVACKDHADALNHPWPSFWISFGSVGLNVLLNWLFIWGHWGVPALGLEGAAWATLIARTTSAVVMFTWLIRSKTLRGWIPTRWFERCQWTGFTSLLSIGLPASFGLLTEVGAFAAASLLIGTLGTAALAAHQVAITCAATTFMVPLGVGMALTVRVGQAVGAGQRPRLHRILGTGWLFAVGFMATSALTFLILREPIARLFVSDPAVIAIATHLLVIGGVFQLVDGLQVVSANALRGVGDVHVPAVCTLIAYWGLALPIGSALAFFGGFGPDGMWIGLAIGLAAAAAALSHRAWRALAVR